MATTDEGPVVVFETGDPGLLAIAQSLLEDVEIEFFVQNANANALRIPAYGPAAIQVAAEDAEKAREALAPLLAPATE